MRFPNLAAPAVLMAMLCVVPGCVSETEKKIESLRADPGPENCLKHLSDPDPVVRLAAAIAVEKHCGKDGKGLQGLLDATADKHPAVRVSAISSIKRLDAAARNALPYLLDRLADESDLVRIAAIDALGRLGNGDKQVTSMLGRILLDAEEYYPARVEAALALGRGTKKDGFHAAETAEKLEVQSGKTDPVMSLCATFLSLQSGGEFDRLVKHVSKRMNEGNATERNTAARMLGILGQAAKNSVPDLLRALEDKDEGVKASAAESIGLLNSAPAQAIPALLKTVVSETTLSLETSLAAAGAVAEFGSQSVPYLLKNIESLDSKDRFWAVFILGEIGPKARPSLPAIRRLLQSQFEDSDVIMAADIAVRRISNSNGR